MAIVDSLAAEPEMTHSRLWLHNPPQPRQENETRKLMQ